jgi:hypothetical protein
VIENFFLYDKTALKISMRKDIIDRKQHVKDNFTILHKDIFHIFIDYVGYD